MTWLEQAHRIEDILPKLSALEEIVCDEDLEEWLCQNREKMPKLQVVNGVSLEETGMIMRKKQHRVNKLMDKLP